MQKIAIIGRPNVGKSTLFNRLIGKKKAIVHDTPGVTRDRKTHEAQIKRKKFELIDTAGLEKSKKALEKEMVNQTELALAEADIIIFLTDGTSGITNDDKFFADKARKTGKTIISVVNKCERKDSEISEAYKLGFGEPIAISAEHNQGMEELYAALNTHLDDEFVEEEEKAIKFAIVGRPNVGKSTLVNAITNDNRVIASPIAGTTRDAIEVNWEYEGQNIQLIDTAGMRKKSNVTEKLEYYSVGDSLNAIKFAQIVALVLDATEPLEKQDLRIARHIVNEGRALIIVVNKWDLREGKNEFKNELKYLLDKQINDVAGISVVYTSAKNKKNIEQILETAMDIYQTWNIRISTGKLNRWLEHVLNTHPPPLSKGRRIKMRYVTQVNNRPPSFMISTSQPDALPDSYAKYLKNNLRDNFDMKGVPIRLMFRGSKNPYENKKYGD